MPFIDVTDLLSDPDIAGQAFDVIRNTAVVSTTGSNTLTSSSIPAVIGSVQPASSSDLQRLPDGEFQKGALKVRTTFVLTSGGAGKTADKIRWPASTGPMYVVQTVDDWTQFGAGYVEALITLVDLNP